MKTLIEQMRPHIKSYLQSCAYGLWDGSLKATSHEALVTLFVAQFGGNEDLIRFNTRKLTDNLDEEIGFPLKKAPHYDKLIPLFYEKFIHYAKEVL